MGGGERERIGLAALRAEGEPAKTSKGKARKGKGFDAVREARTRAMMPVAPEPSFPGGLRRHGGGCRGGFAAPWSRISTREARPAGPLRKARLRAAALSWCLLAALPSTGLAEQFWQVQVGQFEAVAAARGVAVRIQKAGVEAVAARSGPRFVVSAGIFRIRQNAERRRQRLNELGLEYKVRIVPYPRASVKPAGAARAPTGSPFPPPPAGGVDPGQRPTAGAEEAPGKAATPRAPGTRNEKTVMTFGPAAEPVVGAEEPTTEDVPPPRRPFQATVEDLWLEAGALSDGGVAVEGSHYLHAAGALQWQANTTWTLRGAVRADGYAQTGDPSFEHSRLDYGETYLRYRGEGTRITLGAQKVLWGRVDEIAPTDRLATPDLRRYVLDGLQDRRLASPALRAEWFGPRYKLDAVLVPDLREAELPPSESIWHPLDRVNGEIMGLQPDPVLAAVIQNGTLGADTDGAGGGGVRISRTGEKADAALTIQRMRHLTPYYELDDGVRAGLLAGDPVPAALANATGATLMERHPWTTLVGADLGVPIGRNTWRLELAWRSDVPVTAGDLSMQTAEGVDWVAGVELYPGDGDARLNLQVAGHHLLNPPDGVLDRDETYLLNGELENNFARARWRAGLRFFFGLNEKDVYLNPEIAYVGIEPHTFYLEGHYFDGDAGTPGGFHQDHSLLALGWRVQY